MPRQLLLPPGHRLINSTALPIPFLLFPPLRRHMTEMFPRLCHPRATAPNEDTDPAQLEALSAFSRMLTFNRMQGTHGSPNHRL